MRRRVVVGAVACLTMGTLACTSPSAEAPGAARALPDCSTVSCTGSIEGAKFEIVLPETWNGTLLIYSHGYRPEEPFPPFFETVPDTAVPAPGWDSEQREVGNALLERGFALAGSAYSANGWAVEEGVQAARDLHRYFADTIAVPERVYVWGDSLGGLVTAVLAEQDAEWVDGALSLCGVMAGAVDNFDLALDTTYAIRELLYPGLKITGFTSYTEALLEWEKAASTLVEGARSVDTDAIAAILTVAAVVDAPRQTGQFDGASATSLVAGSVESLLTALAYGTVGRADVESRFGGNISDNAGLDYGVRITPAERATIDTFGGEGTAERLLAKLAAGDRVTSDAVARTAAADRGGSPTGGLRVPMITVHTAADPLVIAQNQSRYRARYDAAVDGGQASADLVQLFTTAPPTYPTDPGAPYGAGHCNFTPASRIGAIDLLDGWIREGRYPGSRTAEQALGDDSGYSPLFTPGPWPRVDGS